MLSILATKILAISALSLIGLALIARAVLLFRRSPYSPVQTAFYGLNYLVVRLFWRARITGRVSLPPDQGAVIVCNHRSPADPAFIFLAVDRMVHWMVAKEYCARPAFAWLLRLCEVIPTSRRAIDTVATRSAIRYAREGSLVGVLPEGRINTTDRLLLPGRPGAAMIALKARVPVVPCYLSGSPFNGKILGSLFTSASVRLRVGQPIDISEYYGRENDRRVLESLTKRFLVEIARLAGHADYQPELAGRFYKPGLADD